MWTSIFVIPRSKTLTLKKPNPIPKEQRTVFRAPDLRDILREFSGEECYPSGCLWVFCDGGKMERRLQFLDVDRDNKTQILCAYDVVILW